MSEDPITAYARSEMRRAGLFDEDSDYGGMLAEAVLKMCRVFADEGHSGASASMAVGIFRKVAMFEPLTPLTGEDDEWTQPFSEDGTMQNVRCSHVFKRPDGTAYDINAVVFREPNGLTYTSSDSRRDITFPYVPTTEYVDVPEPSHD